jgi:hypothetical protein
MKLQSQNRSFGKTVATVAIALTVVSAAAANAQDATTQQPAAGAASCLHPYCTTAGVKGSTSVGGPANPNVGGNYTDTYGRPLSDSVIGGTRGPIERIPDKSTGWPFCSSDRGRSCAPCNGNMEPLGVSS